MSYFLISSSILFFSFTGVSAFPISICSNQFVCSVLLAICIWHDVNSSASHMAPSLSSPCSIVPTIVSACKVTASIDVFVNWTVSFWSLIMSTPAAISISTCLFGSNTTCSPSLTFSLALHCILITVLAGIVIVSINVTSTAVLCVVPPTS